MTKKVRVENADNNHGHRLVVETWQVGQEGAPDKLVSTIPLNNPCDMVDAMVWQGQYITVKEVS